MRFLLVVFLSLAGLAWGQKAPGGQGFGWFGLDGRSLDGGLSLGAGGEAYIKRGFALGGDLGYLFPRSRGAFGDGFGLLSLGGSYHFARGGRVNPFLGAGYGLAFRSGTLNTWYWAAGLNGWFSRRLGLRVEFRSFLHKDRRFNDSLRFGLAFR